MDHEGVCGRILWVILKIYRELGDLAHDAEG